MLEMLQAVLKERTRWFIYASRHERVPACFHLSSLFVIETFGTTWSIIHIPLSPAVDTAVEFVSGRLLALSTKKYFFSLQMHFAAY